MPNEIKQASAGQLQQGARADHAIRPGAGRMAATPATPAAATWAMPAEPPTPPAPTRRSAADMAAFTPAAAATAAQARPRSEMKPHPAPAASTAPRESYLRLRVRVVRDRMTIVDAQEVEGPLALSPQIAGEHVYEALLNSRPIAIEGLLDVGVSRSYPRPGKHEHFFTERPTFEFNVRIPTAALPGNALNRIALTLYRLPDASQRVAQGRIAQQFGRQARQVARLDGLRPEAFDVEAHRKISRLFPSFPQAPDL